jgi:hypothetical protein
VSTWHVSDETSLSDHRYIFFQVSDIEISKITYRNPKRTNCESYREDLKVNEGAVPRVVHSVTDVELAVDLVQHAFSPPITKIVQLGWFSHQGGFLGGIKS